jgi:phosphatidylethanolamine-binding protein (PEBP) family uncharacterized protein
VAQRTGAKRFLAPAAKSASARVALALALVAFLLSGCGGGSSDSESGSTTATSTAPAAGPEGAKTASQAAGSKAGQGAKAGSQSGADPGAAGPQGQGGSGGGDSNQGSPGQAHKHGPRIAPPKGPPEQAPTPAQLNSATVADMSLESPAIIAAAGSPGHLAATYTCDGANSWPELRWGGIPAGTAELAVFAMNVQPVEEQLFVDWAVAGLDPALKGIEAGKLPKGAIVGTNGFGKRGYSLCPPGAGEIYMFAVYALPTALSPPKGFDARELRKEVLGASGNVGLLPAVYAR